MTDKNNKLNEFQLLPSREYCSHSCKSPYNIISIAILLLDFATPGYFFNIPKSPNDCNYIGRGRKEAKLSEYYFLVVAILKVTAMFFLQFFILREKTRKLVYTINNSWNIKEKEELIENKDIKNLINYGSIFAIQLLTPIICTMVINLITPGKRLTTDIKYLLSTKYLLHAAINTIIYGNLTNILDKHNILKDIPIL